MLHDPVPPKVEKGDGDKWTVKRDFSDARFFKAWKESYSRKHYIGNNSERSWKQKAMKSEVLSDTQKAWLGSVAANNNSQ